MLARFCFGIFFERAEDLLQTDVAFKSSMCLQLEFQIVVQGIERAALAKILLI